VLYGERTIAVDMTSSSDDDEGGMNFGSDSEEEEMCCGAKCDSPDAWLAAFCSKSEPETIVSAWLESLGEEGRKEADADKHAARSNLKNAMMASQCKTFEADKKEGYKYMGSILRACDEALGCAGKKTFAFEKKRNGVTDETVIEVLPGDGSPGTLGMTWSNFKAATNAELLLSNGITHRLNLAMECEWRFPAIDGLTTAHVAMEDSCSLDDEDVNAAAEAYWFDQLPDILRVLRGFRDEGAMVNINCKMGKNRSGVACLLWLVEEAGWEMSAAVNHLRDINFMALGNPVLLMAVAKYLQIDPSRIEMLPPSSDGCGSFLSISPPASPEGSPVLGPTEAPAAALADALAGLEGDPEMDELD